jgi:hypothetical protein
MDLREALKRPEGKTLEFKEAMPDLDSEALDFRAASESFAPMRRLKRADLDTPCLLTAHQGRSVPTGRGLVLEIGTSPQDPKRRYFLVGGGDA